jgi:hypothetical protein
MGFFLVLVDSSINEFEIVGICQDYSLLMVIIIDFCIRTGKKITCYNPEVKKNTEATVIKNWNDKGFTLSGNIYLSILKEITESYSQSGALRKL